MSTPNPCGLRGIEFTEFCGPDLARLEALFWAFGFSKTRRHASLDVAYFGQNDIHFLLNAGRGGHSAEFARRHGPSICSMGWRVDDGRAALEAAVARGAVAVPDAMKDYPYPAVWGIGESHIYFIDNKGGSIYQRDFIALDQPRVQPDKGFLVVDHLTNNVPPGEQDKWASFYKDIFGFTQVRYFDIKGVKTGLTSFALRSPDGSFCIPINQPKDDRDQIAEYLREYRGPGVQHLAFATRDILASLDQLKGGPIETLEIDDEYYAEVFKRVPGVTEDHARIRQHQVLVDGDEEGYLLQIFTKNLIGPIFIEIIQRANHLGFGEGNFGALFRSLEKDQERRGVLLPRRRSARAPEVPGRCREETMLVQGFHHVAYRCKNTRETIDFYKNALGMDLLLAISEDRVPSTKEPDPYMHIFLDAGRGNVLAFFEVPNSPPMGRDPNTPAWVQHIALQVADLETLLAAKKKLEALGVEVIGPTDHHLFQSIYFHDPNGHRLELAANTAQPRDLERLREIAPSMIDEWSRTRSTVRQAAWLHEKEFSEKI